MTETQGGYRTPVWTAVALTIGAIAGVFLPWGMLFQTLETETVVGPQGPLIETGAYLQSYATVFFLLGLSGQLVSIIAMPWAVRPQLALLGALICLAVATFSTVSAGVGSLTNPHNYGLRYELAHGYWITIGSGCLAIVFTLTALRRAVREAHGVDMDAFN